VLREIRGLSRILLQVVECVMRLITLVHMPFPPPIAHSFEPVLHIIEERSFRYIFAAEHR